MNNSTDSSYVQAVYSVPGNVNPATGPTSSFKRVYYYRIQLSQFSEVFRDYLQNGVDVSANVMTLRFQILDDDLDELALVGAAPGTPANREYFLYAQYVYQASISVQQGVGVFQWVNPISSAGALMNGSVEEYPRAPIM